MWEEKKKPRTCSNCDNSQPSFNLYYCLLHKDKRAALETCKNWELKKLGVCGNCDRKEDECFCMIFD